MTQTDLESWLISRNYHKDTFGHYQKQADSGKIYRFKIQDISVRYEYKANICGKNEWLRIASGYFKDLSISDSGKICGLK